MAKTWREGHTDTALLKQAMGEFDHQAFLKKRRLEAQMSPEELAGQIQMMEIGHLDFTSFHSLAKGSLESLAEASSSIGTVKRLMEGLLHELEFRREYLRIR